MAEVIDLTNMSDSGSDSETQSSDSNNEPLDHLSQNRLQAAILTTPLERLREVLATLSVSNPTIARVLFTELVGVQGRAAPAEESDADACEIRPQPPTLIPTWAVCINCDKEFNEGIPRVIGECRYHPGDLEVNEEAFPDWDEDCHGPMDTESNRREFPENFIWSCCDEVGRSEGCEEDVHRPGHPKKKKPRYD